VAPPEERRKIYKRQWMRRSRRDRKDSKTSGMKVYPSKAMLSQIEALRPKGKAVPTPFGDPNRFDYQFFIFQPVEDGSKWPSKFSKRSDAARSFPFL
jgi:hypothetical protein